MTILNIRCRIVKSKELDPPTSCDICMRIMGSFFLVELIPFNKMLRFCIFCLETAIMNDPTLGKEVKDFYASNKIRKRGRRIV